MIMVKELGPGKGFGEFSLIKNKPRAATAVCQSGILLAVLNKQAYHEILADIQAKIIYEKVEFMKQLHFFEK